MRKLVFVAALAAAVSLIGSSPALAANCEVNPNLPNEEQQLKDCLAGIRPEGGETITLLNGIYDMTMTIGNYGGSWTSDVTITGSRNAVITQDFTLNNDRRLLLTGFTVRTLSTTDPVKLRLHNGTNLVTVDNVLFDGTQSGSGSPPHNFAGVQLNVDDASHDLTVKNSEFKQCGKVSGVCINMGATNFTIEGNHFYPTEGADIIKGGAGANNPGVGAKILNNTFDEVYKVPGCTSGDHCVHLNHIHITGQGPWTIERNTFKDCGFNPNDPDPANKGGCAGSIGIYDMAPGDVRDATIQNNKWVGQANQDVFIGNYQPEIENIKVVNNTCDDTDSDTPCVELSDGWDNNGQPQPNAPIVANNIMKFQRAAECTRTIHSKNFVVSGTRCLGDYGLAPANLNADHDPTASSGLIISGADTAYAPVKDFYDKTRENPEVGAAEYLPFVQSATNGSSTGSTSPSVTLAAQPGSGNLVVLSVTFSGSGTLTCPTSNGTWTLIEQVNNGTSIRQARCYSTTATQAGITASLSASGVWVAIAAEYKDATAPPSDPGAKIGNTGNNDMPDSGTTTVNGGALFLGSLSNNSSSGQSNPTDGFTQRACAAVSPLQTPALRACLYEKVAAPALAHVSATISPGAPWTGAVTTFIR